MRILAVDTSSERGSVSVIDGMDVIGEVRLATSMHHSERLFGSVEFLFRNVPFPLSAVDLFAAARGPGSFTGLRVGLAAMEGFAAAHQKPGAGVTTLEALAWKSVAPDGFIAPTMDARRGEVYGALYRRFAGTLVEERAPVVLKPAQWFDSLPDESIVFCGDGAVQHRSKIEGRAKWSIQLMDLYLASAVGRLAAMSRCGPLEPLYVRKTDAEIARESISRSNP
jgi:tRNA threonylcarbamoyladenosine biosynthesis protein TsaB